MESLIVWLIQYLGKKPLLHNSNNAVKEVEKDDYVYIEGNVEFINCNIDLNGYDTYILMVK